MFSRAWLLLVLVSPAYALRAQDAVTVAPSQADVVAVSENAGAPQCDHRTHLPQAVSVRLDNDLYGAGHQDQGYTNGLKVEFISPDLKDYAGDPCLPRMASLVNDYLAWLAPSGYYDQQNMVFNIAQRMYTPDDPTRKDVITDDRPYAGVLIAGFGYNARHDDELVATRLYLGLVGPDAFAKQAQDIVHKWTGSSKFEGWHNQLRDEPVFQLGQERFNRLFGDDDHSRTWSFDAISHYGAAVGNLATYANVGGELRFGHHLPNDFGSTPLSEAGENTAPSHDARDYGSLWRYDWFITADQRWVLHDITLDGNTFGDSGSYVQRKPLVNYVGYGFALMKGRWKFSFARYWSSREFKQQAEKPEYGSFTISRSID